MLLALDGHEGHFSIGAAAVDQAERMFVLADRWRTLGFTLAPFRSFGRPIDPTLFDDRRQRNEVIECAA